MVTSVILFFITCNTLINFPLDKFFMLVFDLYCIYKFRLNYKLLFLISLSFVLLSIVLVINIFMGGEKISFIVYFPLIGVLFIYFMNRYYSLDDFEKPLFFHIFCATIWLVRGYVTRGDAHIHFLYDKGLPFLAAPMGFTSTVQTFGTLLLSYIILLFNSKKINKVKISISILLLIMTFNRASYGNILIYSLINIPQLLFFICIFVVIFFILKPDIMGSLLGTFGTIKSRIEALLIANSVILKSNIFKFCMGNSNTIISGNEEISVIENGIMQLLYTYGVLFYFIFVAFFMVWLCFMKDNFKFKSKLYITYIVVFAQIFTHEYYSTTLYIILSILFLTSNTNKESHNKKIKKFDSKRLRYLV